jgi:hypothetical protein
VPQVVQPQLLRQQIGGLIQIEATARGRPVEEGGYLWRGELRLWDNEILMGWYAASDGSAGCRPQPMRSAAAFSIDS